MRPLAIETTRFDSICVGCMLMVVGGGMSGSEQCGISPFCGAFESRLPVIVSYRYQSAG